MPDLSDLVMDRTKTPVDRTAQPERFIASAMDMFANGVMVGNPWAVDHWQRMYERAVLPALAACGLAVVPADPDHYVTFHESGWFIEHPPICRANKMLDTCRYNAAVTEICDDITEEEWGRYKITGIDSEGLPSLMLTGQIAH